MIVCGELAPGQALSEAALATRLGISKTPVREALLQLKIERLVEILPQRGTFVFEMSVEDAHALSDLRSVLEVAALRWGMRHDPAGLAAKLKAIVARMKPARTLEECLVYQALDDRLHRCIIQHCGNQYMNDAYESVALLMQTLRNRLVNDPELNKYSLRQHRDLVRYVEQGAVEKAVALLRRHIVETPAQYAQRLAFGKAADRPGRDAVSADQARRSS